MIPLKDDNPTQSRAFVTLLLIAVNVAVFVLFQPHGNSTAIVKLPAPKSFAPTPQTETPFLYARAAVPCEIVQRRPLRVAELRQRGTDACNTAAPVGTVERRAYFPQKSVLLSIVTSMFLHGGWLHLGGNMLFLWIFGNNIEDRFGRLRYLVFYLTAGIVATLTHAFVAFKSTIPLVGASGAIAGVMGAYFVLYPKVRIRTIVFIGIPLAPRIPAWAMLGFWFVSQFFVAPSAGVAWVAHVGGFVFGAVVGLLVRRFDHRRLRAVPRWSTAG